MTILHPFGLSSRDLLPHRIMGDFAGMRCLPECLALSQVYERFTQLGGCWINLIGFETEVIGGEGADANRSRRGEDTQSGTTRAQAAWRNIFILLVVSGSGFIAWISLLYFMNDTVIVDLGYRHFATIFGLPAAAAASLVIVLVTRYLGSDVCGIFRPKIPWRGKRSDYVGDLLSRDRLCCSEHLEARILATRAAHPPTQLDSMRPKRQRRCKARCGLSKTYITLSIGYFCRKRNGHSSLDDVRNS